MKRFVCTIVTVLLVVLRAPAQSPITLEVIQDSHPRILFRDQDMAAIKKAIAADPYLKQQLRQFEIRGEDLLTTAPDTYKTLGPAHTPIDTARDMEGRIITLSGLYRLTGDVRFAGRATQEMLAAAAFPDWYPDHFLDTAELTAAFGVGYDWLYATLSPADRTAIHDALVTKGIAPWLDMLDANKFHHDNNNWAQVCHGGETLGALAIAEHNDAGDLDRARRVLGYARPAMAKVMQLFAPDGDFEEGPVYWNYATVYNALYIAALDSSLGTDFGASNATGFSSTGDYRIQSVGPFFKYANFSDAKPDAFPAPQMLWLARRFRNPTYAAQERALDRAVVGRIEDQAFNESSRFAMLGLMWDALAPASAKARNLPLAESFTRVAQTFMRSVWNDPDAWYVGFKGGDAQAPHAHLDLGSFVLDALDRRWALDPGNDSYFGLPGYFGPQRWNYYRLRTEGHNTLTVDGQNEDLDAVAPLLSTGTKPNNMFAVADLDKVYKGKLRSWRRGITLLDRRRVLVQDEIQPAQVVDIVWNFHTAAAITIASDGRSAKLTQDGVTLDARILSPTASRFDTASTQVPPPQASNKGMSNLVIRLSRQSSEETIAVTFTESGDTFRPKLKPLSAWRARH